MPGSDRREFLRLLAAASALLAGARSPREREATVTATATPFYAPPDGERCLVRFVVAGLSAPAGRLRAFDAARRPFGTAGVLPAGEGRLYGELWLPVAALKRFRTELAAPGLSRPLVTWHELAPAPRWTVWWVAVLDPEELAAAVDGLAPIPRAVQLSLLKTMGAAVNPLPAGWGARGGELPFLRQVEAARRAATAWDLPLSPIAVLGEGQTDLATLPTVLAGSGIAAVLWLRAPEAGHYRWQGRDGSLLEVVALTERSSASALEVRGGLDRLAASVERWLGTAPELGSAAGGKREGPRGGARGRSGGQNQSGERLAVLVSTSLEELTEAWGGLRRWNARFAYPRFVTSGAEALLREAGAAEGAALPVRPPPVTTAKVPPSLAAAGAQAALRAAERERRAGAMIETLVRLLPEPRASGLEAIAQQLAFPLPGTLVFNPTSYVRSEVARLADGSEHVVADVPPLGYAYIPLGSGGGSWRPFAGESGSLTVETKQFAATLDPAGGAVKSLISADGREWAGSPLGLNAMSGAELEGFAREYLPGVGARIVAQRRWARRGRVRTTVTVYETLPFVDLVNQVEVSGEEAVGCHFGFALDVEAVDWDIPAGWQRTAPPATVTPLRWVRLAGKLGTVLMASLEWAAVEVDGSGRVTSYGPRGLWRHRVAVMPAGRSLSPEEPWRLGWGLEPLVTAPVPGTGGATLPSFGRLLVVDQPGVVVLGLEPARREEAVVVYLQELTGRTRTITLGAALLDFEDAKLVDLLEREQGSPAWAIPGGVGVVVPGSGVRALELLGVRLARS